MYEVKIESKAKRLIRKLPKKLKEIIDEEINKIRSNPLIGELKKGDLKGIRIHKFKFFDILILIAYEIDEEQNQIIIFFLSQYQQLIYLA